ncbi:MAG: hypothetical protein M1832_002351 [Thelocarpon impressellum]|nr:MAG: hypothetical protein M1832_002351 [Thelocarpon impressellum]
MAFFPAQTLHAEAPATPVHPQGPSRKPIYDDDDISLSPSPDHVPTSSPSRPTASSPVSARPSESTSPTPTDHLAQQIRRGRLYLHGQAVRAEDTVNAYLTSALDLEHSFTSTIVSLAPPRESGERLMPGAIYVLVAAMAGSIISRNRNVVLRAAVPAAMGLGAAWVVLPLTMRNVGDLAWRYEQRVPVVAENHLRVRGAAEQAWRTARRHGESAVRTVDETVHGGRAAVEDWVRKGR